MGLRDGRRAVVRNGTPEREILTAVGPVSVQGPKIRDRSGAGVRLNSALEPPYVRRSARVAAALPWLYLEGISSGDLGEALEVLLGEGAKGLSPAALSRLKAQWSEEYQGWSRRPLTEREYAYWWMDGMYTTLRESDDLRLCLLVIIGVRADGTEEWVAIEDGLGLAGESWLDVLRDLKARGLKNGPCLAVGDGVLGFPSGLEQVYPDTAHQRCWFHKTGNVVAALPQSLQSEAKADPQASLPGGHIQGHSARLRALREPLPGQVPEGHREAGEGARRLARLLRLSGRAPGEPLHHQPHRIAVRDCALATAPRGTQALRLALHLPRPRLQVGRRCGQALAVHGPPEKIAELLAGTHHADRLPVLDAHRRKSGTPPDDLAQPRGTHQI